MSKISAKQAEAWNKDRTVSKSVLEATILVEYTTAQVIKCKARETFTKGRVTVKYGSEFFLVQSSKFAGRYYVVVWSVERSSWQCSCHCVCSNSAHIKIVNAWVLEHVVAPKKQEVTKVETVAPAVATEKPEAVVAAKVQECIAAVREQAVAFNDAPSPKTAQEWKEAVKRQREADRAYNRAYLEKARELRNLAG